MKYHAVCEKHVRVIELRETKHFLIDDTGSYGRFKKVNGSEILATNKRFSNWVHTGYDIYPLNHHHPLSLIKKAREEMFMFKVQEAIKEKFRKLNSFDQALSLNDLLNLGIEHPNK